MCVSVERACMRGGRPGSAQAGPDSNGFSRVSGFSLQRAFNAARRAGEQTAASTRTRWTHVSTHSLPFDLS